MHMAHKPAHMCSFLVQLRKTFLISKFRCFINKKLSDCRNAECHSVFLPEMFLQAYTFSVKVDQDHVTL